MTGSLLAHMGKHGPMLLLPGGTITPAVRAYLERVRPATASVNDQLTNHGWILGGTRRIPWPVQGDIDDLLEVGR